MFNLNKSSEEKLNDATQDAKTQSAEFLDNTKSRLSDIGNDVKNTANKLGNKVQAKSAETKQDALNLVDNLKALLAKTSDSVEPDEIKNEVANRLLEWKGVVQDEVKHAVDVSRTQTEKVVRDQPLVSLAVAVGAGILIGYLVANNKDK
jgi:ElaB/YqjD/DUF883 family membrane-anchored ribosome-binding protein